MGSKKENPEHVVQAWLDKVNEDYLTAQELLKSGRYTWCAFACQQFLEKYLKAAYVKRFEKVAPYTHNLLRLCKELSLDLPDPILDSMTLVDKYYLATRYPSYKENLNISNRTEADKFFQKAKEIFEWLKQKLNV